MVHIFVTVLDKIKCAVDLGTPFCRSDCDNMGFQLTSRHSMFVRVTRRGGKVHVRSTTWVAARQTGERKKTYPPVVHCTGSQILQHTAGKARPGKSLCCHPALECTHCIATGNGRSGKMICRTLRVYFYSLSSSFVGVFPVRKVPKAFVCVRPEMVRIQGGLTFGKNRNEISKYPSIHISKYRSIEIKIIEAIKYWNFQILKYRNIQASRHPNIKIELVE